MYLMIMIVALVAHFAIVEPARQRVARAEAMRRHPAGRGR